MFSSPTTIIKTVELEEYKRDNEGIWIREGNEMSPGTLISQSSNYMSTWNPKDSVRQFL